MIFLTFSKRLTVLAAFSFSLLLCASAPAEDYVPLEDVTKLERPTICIKRDGNLRLIDWDGQNERLWMTGDFGSARFSRDGKYASFFVGDYKHYILELETGRLINMEEWRENNGYEHLYISGDAWWFPDGRRLACRGNVKGGQAFGDDIYVLDLDRKRMIRLTKTPHRDEYWATVSPDGKTIAFNSYPPSEEERAALGIEHFPTHLYTMRSSDGRRVVNLTNSGASYKYPAWSPDGKKIAFAGSGRPVKEEDEPNGPHIFIINPDGSNLERLTFPKDGVWALPQDWSADSKWVLYTMKDEEAPGSPRSLYRIHIKTREIVRIRTPSALARWVYAGKSRFLSVDPAGKKKAQWGALKEAGIEKAPQETDAHAEE